MKKAAIVDCFNHYDYRTNFIKKYLSNIGYEVTIIIADFDHLSRQYVTPNIDDLCLISVPKYKKNLSISRIYSHVVFANKTIRHISSGKYDLVFCEVPPNYLVKTLSKLKNIRGYRLYFDIIDLWPESFPYGDMNILPFRIWKNMRDEWLKRADGVAVECGFYSEILKKRMPHLKTYLVPLAKKELAHELIEKWEKTHYYQGMSNKIVLAYLGSINSLIDIDAFCCLINTLKKTLEIEVRIIGGGEKRQELINRLCEEGAKVDFLGKIFDEERIMDAFADCHMGVNLYKSGLKIGMTIKSLDYYRLGLPIINSIGGDTMSMVRSQKIGINYSKDSFKTDDIMSFVESPKESRANVWRVYRDHYSELAINRSLHFLEGDN